jgi:hypothetical protein
MTIMLSGSDLTVMAAARLGEAVALAPTGRAYQLTRELAGFTRSDGTLPPIWVPRPSSLPAPTWPRPAADSMRATGLRTAKP